MQRSLLENTWVTGEQFTLADIALIPTLVRMLDIGLSHVWDVKPQANG